MCCSDYNQKRSSKNQIGDNKVNLERLKSFYRVARFMSYTKAAEAYNLTPGALNKSVKALEDELQVQLFENISNVLCLTQEGERLFSHASQIIETENYAEEYLLNEQNSLKGHVNIYAPTGFSSVYLPEALADFMMEYPDITITVKGIENRPRAEYLSNGLLIHPYIDDLTNYEQKNLIILIPGLFASKFYVEKYGRPKSISDLSNHRLIANSFDREYKFFDLNWHLKIGMPSGKLRSWVAEVDASFGRSKLANKGVGIIAIPKQHPDIKKYGLIDVMPNVQTKSLEHCIISSQTYFRYKKVKLLSDFLINYFRD